MKVGALHEFGSRGSLLASMDRIMAMAQRKNQLRQSGQTTMFDLFGDSVGAPLSAVELVETEDASPRERQEWERELLGKQISDNPISAIAADPNSKAIAFRGDLDDVTPNKRVTVVGQVYSVRNPRTKDGRAFAVVELELLGGRLEVVAWPDVYEKDTAIWAEGAVLLVVGKVRTRDDKVVVHAEEGSVFTAEGDKAKAGELPAAETAAPPPGIPPNTATTVMNEPPPFSVMEAPGDEIPAALVASASSNGTIAVAHTNGTNGKNGTETQSPGTFLISLTDSGDSSEDTFLVQSAIRLTLEFQGNDSVQLEISSKGKRVRLEMPLISTHMCQELEERMASLIGPGRARAV